MGLEQRVKPGLNSNLTRALSGKQKSRGIVMFLALEF